MCIYHNQNITIAMIFHTTHPKSISFEPCLAPPIKRMFMTKDVVETINAGPAIKISLTLNTLDTLK